MMIPPLEISEATTRITGPLTDKGQIDFFKALEQKISPPELATDENGYRVYFRYFGDTGWTRKPEHHEFYRLQNYEKLGLDPIIPPTLVFPLTPDKILEEYYKAKEEEYQKNTWDRPWTLEEYPMLADWINEIDEPLDAIAEAISKPVFFMPLLPTHESVQSGEPQGIVETFLPDLESLRSIAQILQTRALYRIGQGNIDGAIDDKLTLRRLGRLITQSGIDFLYYFGTTFENMGVAIPVGANPEHPLTKEQIQRILDELDGMPPRASIRDIIEVNRYGTLAVAQEYMRAPDSLGKHHFILVSGSGAGQAPEQSLGERIEEFIAEFTLRSYHAFTRTCNWNVVFRRINEVYDETLESPTQEHWRFIRATVESILGHPSPLFSPDDRALEVVRVIFRYHKPPVHLEFTIQRSECSENMQRLALAILQYQREHGTMSHGNVPGENWAVLIKPYLGENAERYFSCPTNPSPEGMTTYALVQYDDTNTDTVGGSLDTIILIELLEPMPFDKAIVSVDEALELLCDCGAEELECCGQVRMVSRRKNAHGDGMNVVYRSGAVRVVSATIERAELLRSLGRETE